MPLSKCTEIVLLFFENSMLMKYMQLGASNIILFVQQLSEDREIDDMATI